MNVQEAIKELQKDIELTMRLRKNSRIDGKSPGVLAMETAIKSLEMQDKLKQRIENCKNPEFKDATITRDRLVDILEEFRLECETGMSKEELVEKLKKVGINGEWVRPDKYGFSRIFQFKVDKQIFEIEWFCNYSTLIIDNVHFLFDSIKLNSCYPCSGKWIEFSSQKQGPIYLKISGVENE